MQIRLEIKFVSKPHQLAGKFSTPICILQSPTMVRARGVFRAYARRRRRLVRGFIPTAHLLFICVFAQVKKKKKFAVGDAVRFLNAAKGKMDVGVIHSLTDDGKITLALATGGRKTGLDKQDVTKASTKDIANR
jgi:hypothetical protein